MCCASLVWRVSFESLEYLLRSKLLQLTYSTKRRKELTEVKFEADSFIPPERDTPLDLPFRLSKVTLRLGYYFDHLPLSVLHSLLQPTTSTLSIEFVSSRDYFEVRVEEYLYAIEMHAPGITTLELYGLGDLVDLLDAVYWSQPDGVEAVEERMQSFCLAFTGLRYLMLGNWDLHYLWSMPSTLEVLKVCGNEWQEFWESDWHVTRFKGLLGSAFNLKRVQLESLSKTNEGAMVHQSRVGIDKLCEKRGIRLEWIGIWPRLTSELAPQLFFPFLFAWQDYQD